MMKTYAVLLAPEFRLQATVRYRPKLRECPVALVEKEGTKLRVQELNPRAQAYQVERGMTSTQAVARCPELQLLSANARQEQAAQEILLSTAECLSPFLESTGPGVITVELPPERVFGENDFIDRLVIPVEALGLKIQVGVAGTPDLAGVAARFGRPVKIAWEATAFLNPLPIEALQPGKEMENILKLWGIRTVGQFTMLPVVEVMERLGPEALQLWERAKGGRGRPLKLMKAQEFFAEGTDLDHPVEMLEPLLFVLRRFLEQIATRLGHVHLVADKLRLTLRFEYGEPYRQVFTIPQPTQEVTLLFRMLHTHLENFVSKWPIVGLELAAKPVRPTAEQFSLLEKGLRDPHQFAETLARLQALLGADQVGTPEIDSSHHPDAFHLRPYRPAFILAALDEEPLIGVPWLRFHPPVPAKVILNEVLPAFLYSAQSTGPIKDARGPWLREGDWWTERPWAREEWDIATEEGSYRLVRAEEQWFLDGIYA